MQSQNELTRIEQSLLVSNTILTKVDSLLTALRDKDIEKKDYAHLSLMEALLLEVCKYVEEYEKQIIPTLNEMELEWIIKIHSPLFGCLKNSNIKHLRNRHIAHPHRDQSGGFIFLMDTIVDEKLSVSYLDILFYGECTKLLIIMTATRLKDPFESAISKYENHIQSGRIEEFYNLPSSFENYIEVKENIKSLVDECDDIFNKIFPNETAWNNR